MWNKQKGILLERTIKTLRFWKGERLMWDEIQTAAMAVLMKGKLSSLEKWYLKSLAEQAQMVISARETCRDFFLQRAAGLTLMSLKKILQERGHWVPLCFPGCKKIIKTWSGINAEILTPAWNFRKALPLAMAYCQQAGPSGVPTQTENPA